MNFQHSSIRLSAAALVAASGLWGGAALARDAGETFVVGYQCANSHRVAVTYHVGTKDSTAKVVLEGGVHVLDLQTGGGLGTSVFRKEPYSLHVAAGANLRKAKDMVIYKKASRLSGGTTITVDEPLLKDCDPR